MSNVIKFQAPFERLKQYNERMPEVALNKAIILQAITDASNKSSSPQAKKYEKDAKNWIFGNSNEFIKTCQQANLEPDFVRNIAMEIINLHHNGLTSSDKGKLLSEISHKFNSLV